VVTNPPVTPPPVVTNPPTVITNPPISLTSFQTNNVTLDVTLKLANNTTTNASLPGQIVLTDNRISNIIFDLTKVPVDAIIIRVRLYDYIYDPNAT
jgi:hypothetical protein